MKLESLIKLAEYYYNENTRMILGITGPPGSGKSTLSDYLSDQIAKIHGEYACISLGMDGFHLSNDYLKEVRQI